MPNIKQIRADLEPGIGWVHRGFKGFGMILTSQEIALLHTFIVSFVFTFPFYSIKYVHRVKLFQQVKLFLNLPVTAHVACKCHGADVPNSFKPNEASTLSVSIATGKSCLLASISTGI